MYKVIIQTKNNINTTKSPIHNCINLLSGIQQVQYNEMTEQKKNSIVQHLYGDVHLLRNLNASIRQLTSKVKSRALLIINITEQINRYLKQRIQFIEHFNHISHQVILADNIKLGVKNYAVVIFNSLALAEELKQFSSSLSNNSLVLYIESSTIVCTQNAISADIWKQLLKDESSQKQKWVQIPSCIECLQILEPQVSGMNIKQTNHKNEKMALPNCKICWTRSKQQSKCQQCSEVEDNWICMVCGVIGCGRYRNADAYKHYKTSGHILSLDLKTHHIWNYKFDCFSHLVAGRQQTMMEENQKDNRLEIDDDDLQLQFWKYCNVVSEQLDKQRNFYNKIKNEQIQRYSTEQTALQNKIKQLIKSREEKKQNLKKKVKKNKKLGKKCAQIQQECQQQRGITKNLEQSVKSKSDQRNKEIIENKKKQLKSIQDQIQAVYLKMS